MNNIVPTLWHRTLRRLLLAAAALSLAGAALAQGNNGDPPGRVARLSDLAGQVWLYTPDATDWISAVRNRPLTTGDRLATDAGARAELQVGSTTLRLDANTELEVVQLDDGQAALQLHSGSLAVRIRNGDAAREFSLTTSEGRFRVDRAGRYRFDRLDNESVATVYNGSAVYEGSNSALTVSPGQRAEFWIDNAGVAQYSLSSPANDAFASFDGQRDGADDRGAAVRYVSPEMTGADDLDRYGSWEQSADYGPLWIPRGVAADWAPYSTGHWAFVPPWGWTWVDDAPWGFAPFHYGRWVYNRNIWCWAPGRVVARPIYAPALVAWVGSPGLSVSVNIGGGPAVGWFPLAPREVYVPSYRYSPRYVQQINVTNVTNVTQINNFINTPPAQRDFSNRRFPHALTMVPAAVMTNRQPVAPAAAQLRNTPMFRDLAQRPAGRGVALVAPPVAAPVLPARQLGVPPSRPPGFAQQRPEGGRDRPDGGRERPDGGRERQAPAVVAPGPGANPLAAPVARPGEQPPRPAPVVPGSPAPGARPPSPVVAQPEPRAAQPEVRLAPPMQERRSIAPPPVSEDRRGAAGSNEVRPPPSRGDERRAPPPSPVERRLNDERQGGQGRGNEIREAPRAPIVERREMPQRNEAPQAAPPVAPRPVMRPEPPAAVAPPRPVEAARPAAPPQAPRQVEAPARPQAPERREGPRQAPQQER